MQLKYLVETKIQELTHLFSCEVFDDAFKQSLREQANRVYLIAHAQFEAINLKIDNRYLYKFQLQLEIISLQALEQMFVQIKYALKCIIMNYKNKKCKKLFFSHLDFASGETHNGKKCILIFSLNCKKIVFRPYPSYYLNLLTDIYNLIKPSLNYSNSIFPNILYQGENYVIIEFVKNSCYTKKEQVYYQVGVVFAFSYLMRIIDLYGDNVIFSKNSICIVDAEACFYRDRNDSELNVKDIGLIGHGAYSGLVDSAKSEFVPKFDNNTGKTSFLGNKKRNKLYKLHLLAHKKIILKGFTDCYHSVFSNKKKILSHIKYSQIITRQILRPTKVYTYWQSKLFSPSADFNINVENILIEMRRYILGDLIEEDITIISQYELADIILTDIPFFYTKSTSISLYWKNEVIVEKFFKTNFNDFFAQSLQRSQNFGIKKLVIQLEALIDISNNCNNGVK